MAMIRVTCPNCGHSSSAPIDKLPDRVVNLNCKQCGQTFPFDGAAARKQALSPPSAARADASAPAMAETPSLRPAPPSTERVYSGDLLNLGDLLKTTWEVFCRRFKTLIALYLTLIAAVMLSVIPASVGLAVVIPQAQESPAMIAVAALLVLVMIAMMIVAGTWSTSALTVAVSNDSIRYREAFGRGWELFGAFFWLLLLIGFIVGGNMMLFLLPGMAAGVYFSNTLYVLAAEGLRGKAALGRSYEYIRGNFWQVFLLYAVMFVMTLVVGLVGGLLEFIPIAGHLVSMALQFVIGLFSLVYYVQIYRKLKELRRGQIDQVHGEGAAQIWILLAVLGHVLVIVGVVLAVMMGGANMPMSMH